MKHIIWKPYWNYEKEEKWLNDMSAKGLAMWSGDHEPYIGDHPLGAGRVRISYWDCACLAIGCGLITVAVPVWRKIRQLKRERRIRES